MANTPTSDAAGKLSLLFGVGATLALYLSGFFVVLTPLPLFYVGFRYGRGAFINATLATLAVLLPIYFFALEPLNHFYKTNPHFAWILPVPGMGLISSLGPESASMFGILFYFILVLTSFALDRIFKTSVPLFEPIFTYVALIFLLTLASYYVMVNLHASDPLAMLKSHYLQSLDDFIKIQKEAGMSLSQLAFLNEYKETLVTNMLRLTPAFVFSFYMVLIVVNYYAAKRLFAGQLILMQRVQFGQYVVPFNFVWIVIAFLALLLFSLYTKPIPALVDIAANGLVVFGILYLFQGLAIISYFLSKKNIGFLGVSLCFLIIVFLFQLLGPVLVLGGFFDSWIHFRKLGEKPGQPDN
ncbi:YybS family protein [bacterium]|nr:YybS family protein [bacterium]